MDTLEGKLRLMYNEVIEVNKNTYIVKDTDGYKLIKTGQNISLPYDYYGVLTPELIVFRNCMNNRYDLYMNGSRIAYDKEHNEILIKIKELITELTFDTESISNNNMMMNKVVLNDNFYVINIRIRWGTKVKVIYNKHGQAICSFNEGFQKKFKNTSDLIVMSKAGPDNYDAWRRTMYTVSDKLDNALERFGSNDTVVLDTNGNVVYATDKKVEVCGETLIVDNKVAFMIKYGQRINIATASKYGKKTIEQLYGKLCIMHDGKPNKNNGRSNAIVMDTETNETWCGVKVCKYNKEMGILALDDGVLTTVIELEKYNNFDFINPVEIICDARKRKIVHQGKTYEVKNGELMICEE